MQKIPSVRFDDDDQNSFDDMDALFDHLERFEPPVDMVKRIMDAVAKLPPHQPQAPFDRDGLVIYHDGKQPS